MPNLFEEFRAVVGALTGAHVPYALCGGIAMSILRIEHPVADYAAWKQAFDADPVGRERSGVRSYRVMRPLDDDRSVERGHPPSFRQFEAKPISGARYGRVDGERFDARVGQPDRLRVEFN